MREIAQKLSRCSSFGALMDDAFARCPEREAIVYEDWRLTYGDLERYIHQTAHYLRHLGVRKGSRVAILSRNCPEWIIAEFALYQLGSHCGQDQLAAHAAGAGAHARAQSGVGRLSQGGEAGVGRGARAAVRGQRTPDPGWSRSTAARRCARSFSGEPDTPAGRAGLA